MFAGKRRVGDFGCGDAERLREVLEERAAAARAGLVHHDVADDAVGKPDGLHILAADIEDEAGVGHVAGGGMGVRHRFDGMVIGVQRAVEQQLAVAGGADAGDVERDAGGSVSVAQAHERAARHLAGAKGRFLALRAAFVVGVEAVDELVVVGDERQLGGGAARVDAEPYAKAAIAYVGFRGVAFGAVRFLGQLVAPLESLTLGGGFEEGPAGSVVVVGAGEAGERLRSCGGIDGCGRVGEHAGKR